MKIHKKMIQVKILDDKIGSDIALPSYQTNGSAGMDLYACLKESIILCPGKTVLIHTGIAVYIAEPDYAGIILPRSGLGHTHGIVLGNLVGLIDSDYQGEILISCWNRGLLPFTIESGMRIAQFILVPVLQVQFDVVDEFKQLTSREAGSFGHTGINK